MCSSSSTFHLRAMGFCGADDTTEPEKLLAISKKHPYVEWGVLFREELQGTPRYASWSWLERLATVVKSEEGMECMRTAGHLCGDHVEEVLQGNPDFVEKLRTEFGFARFQINPTAANGVDSSDLGASVDRLREVFSAVPDVEFIVQANDETEALWRPLVAAPPPNMAVLFDESKGLGRLPDSWPAPHANVACGYAGGLGPHNIEEQLRRMAAAAQGTPVWCDAETGLRQVSDGKDVFDLERCTAFVSALERMRDQYDVTC